MIELRDIGAALGGLRVRHFVPPILYYAFVGMAAFFVLAWRRRRHAS